MDDLTEADIIAVLARLADCPAVDAARAVQAIADGTYGLCAACGDPIPVVSLLERPTLALCSACESDLRDRNQARRFGICGVRGSD